MIDSDNYSECNQDKLRDNSNMSIMMRTVIDNYLELFSLITVNCHVRPENIFDNLSSVDARLYLQTNRVIISKRTQI